MTEPSILAVILAGGTGGRLGALTDGKARPVVPVGGTYRLIDVPLSNLHHSHISDVWVVEQYQPKSINDHRRPILSASPRRLPAYIADSARIGSSLIAPGASVAGSVVHSVIGTDLVVEEGAVVEHSVVLDRAHIPAGAVLRSVIVDAGAELRPGVELGENGIDTVVDANGHAARPDDANGS